MSKSEEFEEHINAFRTILQVGGDFGPSNGKIARWSYENHDLIFQALRAFERKAMRDAG